MRPLPARLARALYRATIVAALVFCLLWASPAAMAQKKKDEPVPTKSYVFPYFIVMMLLGMGIMAVSRPGSRKDKVDELKKKEEQ